MCPPPLRHRWVLAYPQRLGAANNRRGDTDKGETTGAKVGLQDQVHFLCEITLSRLGEVAVLPKAQKTTRIIKENEETGICPEQKNKINLQKQILMKWRYMI